MPDKTHFVMRPAIHPHHRLSMRALLGAAFCVASLCASQVALFAAAANRPAAKGPTDRYLLIVDTSAAMARNAQNTPRLVSQLMTSGMLGQTRPGDTIGLWTFNEELQTGSFPLQLWTPQTRQRIASAMAQFLAQHRYEKQSRFDKVIGPLAGVVEDSERITVIILTDGSEKFSGTPYDQEINESYRLNYEEQRKQQMPFITVLRARRGEYLGWRVNTLPFRPEFPAFPIEPKSDEPPVTTTEPKPDSKPEPAPTPVPSLVVIGEKPPALSTPTNAPAAELPQPDVTRIPATPDPVAKLQPDTPPSPPVETPKTAPAETTVAKPVSPPEVISQPATPPTDVTPGPREIASEPPPTQPTKSDTPVEESKPADPVTPAVEADTPTKTVQTAVATPAASLFNRMNLLIAGAVLLVAGVGLIYLLMRRASQPAGKVSLITRSMDRDQK
jgi:hypothetical protein